MPPTELDLELLPEVLDALNTYGRDASFYSKPTGYTASGGSATPGTLLGTTKISPPATDVRFMDADLMLEGDVGVVLAASGLAFTPEAGQLVVFTSQTWGVVAVKRYDSGELTCAWALHLRRSGS